MTRTPTESTSKFTEFAEAGKCRALPRRLNLASPVKLLAGRGNCDDGLRLTEPDKLIKTYS